MISENNEENWGKKVKHQTKTKSTRCDSTHIRLICCSGQLTCAFSSYHTQHMPKAADGSGSQRDRLTHKVKRRSQKREAGANPLDARCPPPGAACLTVTARVPLQTGKNNRKTPAAAPAASAAAVVGWEGSPHLSDCQPRPGPVAVPKL